MRYEVSKAYMSERQSGPRRGVLVMIFTLLTMFFVYWKTHQVLDATILFGLGSCAFIMAIVGVKVSQRMIRNTKAYKQYAVVICSEGIEVQSSDWQFSVPAKDFCQLIIFSSLFSPRLTFFQLKHGGGRFFTLPIESPECFIEEFIRLFPNVPVTKRIKLLLNFE